jgi:UDP-glucuronate 4-epimerase
MHERFLITGANGCIGAWVVAQLTAEQAPVVALDASDDDHRLRLLLDDDALAPLTRVRGDITDLDALERTLDEHGITHVIHLAALQVPACRANPPLGALVNVVGTVNVFEAVKRRSERIQNLVYTGSMGMFGPDDADPVSGMLEPDATPHPGNHYGVYKQANEGNARVYFAEHGVSSIGLRPMTVYGPGRDFGVTSTPTKAIAAAVSGRPYTISFGGATVFQLAEDVGRTLLLAARSGLSGARVFNMGGNLSSIRDFISLVEAEVPEARGTLDSVDAPLPFPEQISDRGLDAIGEPPITPLEDGIRITANFFRDQIARGIFSAEKHGLEPLEPAVVPTA